MSKIFFNNIYNVLLIIGAPLEQFEFNGYFSFIFIFLFLGLFFLIEKKIFFSKSFFGVYGSYSFIFDYFLFNIVYSLVKTNVTGKIQIYFPFFYFLFICILISNFCGLLPYNGTATASITFTLLLTTCSFIWLSTVSIFTFGKKVLYFFYPSGAPKMLLKFLIIIELISYLVRLVSLPVRLIANLVSGHALLKILVGFILVLFSSNSFFKIFIILPWLLILIILVLEAVVGFLQAYVFIFLLTIYLNQALTAGEH